MNDEMNPESSAAAEKPKRTRAKRSASAADATEPAAKTRTPSAKTRKSSSKTSEAEPAAKPSPKKKTSSRRKTSEPEESVPAAAWPGTVTHVEDPIGDVSDGEAKTYTGEGLETDAENEAEAYRAGVAVDAVDGTLEARQPGAELEPEDVLSAAPARIAEDVAQERKHEAGIAGGPPLKLERLQKILSQAGIASRRKAEEMIIAGRVAVNGQVVTALGSKADPERDHIRVDGKLLHGAERHRYFVLNKPKGYMTTVSDPEGRPTVMEFVQKLGERVYPVGRLDYQSEGLLIMTNDGALANQLTHASSGVEKTYLVKIAGQPDEEQLDRLRSGVMIERGGPALPGQHGAGGRVRTAPARIRQIRPGENPWYEVVLTEGRNRELRKMFSAIGHYVEKIRRVGYGPLALDLEPGKLRELTIGEVEALRLTAEGKLKPRPLKTDAMLPKEAGRSVEARARNSHRPAESRAARSETRRPTSREAWRPPQQPATKPFHKRAPDRAPERDFQQRRERGFDSRDSRGRGEGRPAANKFRGREENRLGSRERPERPQREFRGEWRPRGEQPARRSGPGRPQQSFGRRREEPGNRPEDREFRNRPNRPGMRSESPATDQPFRAERRPAQGGGQSRFGGAPKSGSRSRFGDFAGERPQSGFGAKGKPGGFSGGRGARGPARFGGKSKPKPGDFRSGPRPGRRPSGGKRRGS